jgi:hypothetical protein
VAPIVVEGFGGWYHRSGGFLIGLAGWGGCWPSASSPRLMSTTAITTDHLVVIGCGQRIPDTSLDEVVRLTRPRRCWTTRPGGPVRPAACQRPWVGFGLLHADVPAWSPRRHGDDAGPAMGGQPGS